MKTNAIVRICIYSILILLLLGILVSVLLGGQFFWDRYRVSNEELEPTILITSPTDEATQALETWPNYDEGQGLIPVDSALGGLYAATENVNIRRSHSAISEALGMVSKGDELKIGQIKTVGNLEWGHVTAPIPGWVCMNYVKAIEAVIVEADTVDAAPADGHYNYAANAVVNVRTAPTSMSEAHERLAKGAQVRIEETANADGVTWGHITAPITGWVKMEYVDKIEAVTVETEAVDAVPADGQNAVALGQLDILATPSVGGTVLDTMEPEEKLVIDKTQTINGAAWGHVAFPVPGWVSMADVKLVLAPTEENGIDAIPEATAATEAVEEAAAPVDKLAPGEIEVPVGQISKLDIEWAAGDVTIRRGNTGSSIRVKEDRPDNAKPMVCEVKEGKKLNIQFQKSAGFNINFGINFGSGVSSKDLTVTVPMDFDLRDLEIDMASGTVEVQGLTIDEIELDCADVECILEDCTVRSLDVDTASGDITFTGSLDEAELDSASSDFVGVFTNTPRSIDMDGMSGALDITLPEDGGFSAKIDGMSCTFHSDFPTSTVNGAYTYGSGACRITVDGMSSDVTIRKAAK